ncbi:MAG: hypothetical protein LH466_03305, partial [Sphingomonas bacterium]|nr:hypothetical protein [Sphingomonas bacterium]
SAVDAAVERGARAHSLADCFPFPLKLKLARVSVNCPKYGKIDGSLNVDFWPKRESLLSVSGRDNPPFVRD